MKSYVYEDNAGVLLWRGSEVAACPDQSDLHRQQVCFSRKTMKLVHQRRSVAWRLAGFTDFTARGCASPGRPRTVAAWRTPVAWRLARVATFTAIAEGAGEYRTSEEVEDRVRLRPALPTSQDSARLGRASQLHTGDHATEARSGGASQAFLFPKEDRRGGYT